MEKIREGLCYDDVVIAPQYSDIPPEQADLGVTLAEGLRLRLPILSAAMDTVTEAPLAIALARQGGLGVLHANMTIDQQAEQVERVKKAAHKAAARLRSLSPEDQVLDAAALLEKPDCAALPVTRGGKLVGIVTRRDLRFETDAHRAVGEVMTRTNLVTAPEGVSLAQAQEIMRRHRLEKLPIVDKNYHLRGLITIQDVETAWLYPHSAADAEGRLLCGAAVGAREDTLERAEALLAAKADLLFMQSKNAHIASFGKRLRALRQAFPHALVLAGNVASAEGTAYLLDAGADIVNVGVGYGSLSAARFATGIGVPQLTAVLECAKEAWLRGARVVADGGLRCGGDVAKAIAAGGSAVMLGALLAGTEESPGDIEYREGRTFKTYRSITAMWNNEYAQSFREDTRVCAIYKGSLVIVTRTLADGLREAMAHSGAADIDAMREKARFLRVTAAAQRQSRSRDIFIAPGGPKS